MFNLSLLEKPQREVISSSQPPIETSGLTLPTTPEAKHWVAITDRYFLRTENRPVVQVQLAFNLVFNNR